MFTNRFDGKSYIGQSVDIDRRYKEHKTKNDDSYFHRMLRHYGFWNFHFSVIEECRAFELNEKEMFYISKYNTLYPNGYNLSLGGSFPATNALSSFGDVDKIIELLKNTSLSNLEIGDLFGISDQMVSNINTGRSWFRDDITYPIRPRSKKVFYCKTCGSELYENTKTGLCRSCYNNSLVEKIPDAETLRKFLLGNSFNGVGRIFGVSGKTIKKWCMKHGMPDDPAHYKIKAV